MDNETKLFNYVIQNQQYFKDVLLKPLKDDAGALLQDDNFNYEWIDRARWIIATNICINLSMSIDEVMTFLQQLNVKELLK